MKRNAVFILCSLVLAYVLTSCEKAPLGLTKYTEKWFSNRSEAKLTFTSNTGQQEELILGITESTRTTGGKSIPTTYKVYTLTYTGNQGYLGLVIQAERNNIKIRNIVQPNFNVNYAYLTTGKNPAYEVNRGYGVETELLDNFTLNNTTYSRVLRVKFFVIGGNPDKIKEIYYAKHHGLIHFVTTDDQKWSRK